MEKHLQKSLELLDNYISETPHKEIEADGLTVDKYLKNLTKRETIKSID